MSLSGDESEQIAVEEPGVSAVEKVLSPTCPRHTRLSQINSGVELCEAWAHTYIRHRQKITTEVQQKGIRIGPPDSTGGHGYT